MGAHAEFWRALAHLANRLDALPDIRTPRGAAIGHGEGSLLDVKDFVEFRGYAPFSSFLDGDAAAKAHTTVLRKEAHTQYAAPGEALEALAERKPAGGGPGAEAETVRKIRLLLAIVEGYTSEVDGESPCFLTRNTVTGARELANHGGGEEDGEGARFEEDEAPLPEEPTSAGLKQASAAERVGTILAVQGGVDDTDYAAAGTAGGAEDAADRATAAAAAKGAAETTDCVVTANTARAAERDTAVPMKMPYSGQGMALLTPAALLGNSGGGATDRSPKNASAANNNMVAPSIDSILATTMTKLPSNLGNSGTAIGAAAFLDATLPSNPPPAQNPPQGPAAKAPPGLPPPPGFSQHPPPTPAQMHPLAPSATGISLAKFAVPVPGPAEQNVAFGMSHTMPGAEPSYSAASSMLQTMNPFAHQAFNYAHSTPSVSQPPGLLHPTQGGGLARPMHVTNQGGFDPTLNFLSNNSSKMQSPNDLALSSAFGMLVPPPAALQEPEDPSESILKLLFEPHDLEAPTRVSGRPLYENQQPHPSPTTHHSIPHTKNPFAT